MNTKVRRRGVDSCAAVAAAFFSVTACAAANAGVTIETFAVPTPRADVLSIAAASTGDMWFVEYAGDKLGKISPAGEITEFPFPAGSGLEFPMGIGSATDDRLWFTTQDNVLGAVTASGIFQKYPIPSGNNSWLAPVVSGSDDRLYFFEQQANKIGAITTSGVVSEYPVPTSSAEMWAIAAGPDQNIWFTELRGNRIGRMTVSGVITEFPLPAENSLPSAIATGADGNLWFVESRCPACGPNVDSPGQVIGRITPSGVITEFEVMSMHGKDAVPPLEGIAAGPDGALWFTESINNRIGRISTSGAISEFDLPSTDKSFPQSIARSNDGHLWITSTGGEHDYLYKITPSLVSGDTGNVTGSWYDPNQSGQGFNFEVLPGNVLVAYWYTFTPSGEATWISASGNFSGATAKLDGYQIVGSGAKFPPYFDAKNAHPQFWGTMTFTFSDCTHGKLDWSTELPGYGAGTMNLTRLTQPSGTSCP